MTSIEKKNKIISEMKMTMENLLKIDEKLSGQRELELVPPKLMWDEDWIGVTNPQTRSDIAKEEIDNTFTYLHINSSPIVAKIGSINLEHLKTLRINNMPETGYQNCISALKIIFAIASDKFSPYYRPIYFVRKDKCYSQGLDLQGIYEINEDTNTYFTYDLSSGFTRQDLNDIAVANQISMNINNYTQNIRIKHSAVEDLDKHRYGLNSMKDDSLSVIFPFQELFELGEGDSSKNEIFLWNAVSSFAYQQNLIIKHDIVISSDDVTYSNAKGILYNNTSKFSNLSHLCPPGNTFKYYIFRLYQ